MTVNQNPNKKINKINQRLQTSDLASIIKRDVTSFFSDDFPKEENDTTVKTPHTNERQSIMKRNLIQNNNRKRKLSSSINFDGLKIKNNASLQIKTPRPDVMAKLKM